MRQFGNRWKPAVALAGKPKGAEWYLSYHRASVGEYVMYHNLSNAIGAAKNADVLFLGNSRLMFAFGQEELQPFFKALGLRYYVLGFPYHELGRFHQAIIRRYDLRPKWVVVNADPFFVDDASDFAKMVMSEDWWSAWKFKLEMDLAFGVRSRLHQFVPYYDMMCPKGGDCIMFGSYQDGTTHVAMGRGSLRGGRKLSQKKEKAIPPELLTVAKRFKEELDQRGARMVLTTIPPHSPKWVSSLGTALGVPVILPDVTNLTSYDGNHMDRRSAARYASAFLADLEKVIAREQTAQP